jgi:hypothetical protein
VWREGSCGLARVLLPTPHPAPSPSDGERGEISGMPYPGWRSFLTYPGLHVGSEARVTNLPSAWVTGAVDEPVTDGGELEGGP